MKKIKKIITSFIVTLLFLLKVTTVSAEIVDINGSTIETDGYITSSLQDEQLFYVGGNITSVNINNTTPVLRNNIAEVNLTDGVVTEWNPQIDGPVHDLAIYEDMLFIAGQFTVFNEQQVPYLVAINSNTKEIIELNNSVNNPVYALALDQNTLYLGGSFTEINGEARSYITSYSVADNSLSLWSPIVDNTVYDIFIYQDKIYIGGAFTTVEGQERNHLAAFNLSDGMLIDWKPTTDLIITNITAEENKIAVIGFSLLGEEVIAKRLLLDPATGQTLLEEELIIDNPASTELYRQVLTESIGENDLMVSENALGFKIPTLADLLTFIIRAFFAIAGLAALFFMLLGAFAWVTSGGEAEAVGAAQQKIQAAVLGLLMMVVVLALVWTMEQVIFNRRICLGLSCPITIPSLLQPSN